MADALLLVGRGATDVCERGVIVIENSGDGLVTRAARKFARAGDHAVELGGGHGSHAFGAARPYLAGEPSLSPLSAAATEPAPCAPLREGGSLGVAKCTRGKEFHQRVTHGWRAALVLSHAHRALKRVGPALRQAPHFKAPLFGFFRMVNGPLRSDECPELGPAGKFSPTHARHQQEATLSPATTTKSTLHPMAQGSNPWCRHRRTSPASSACNAAVTVSRATRSCFATRRVARQHGISSAYQNRCWRC